MRGVAAAHRQGVVHRDLKPDNIFLCRGPDGTPREPKVLDFGISKVSGQGNQTSPRLTRTGAMMGTPYYMSPEQVRGVKEIGPQVDVYAFGVILYEALAGKVPFHADTFSALVLEIATATAVPLRQLRPDIPEKLEAIVMKAMARETKDRYVCIEDLGRDLEMFGGGITFDVTSHNMRLVDFAKVADAPATASFSATSTPFVSEAPVTEIPGRRRAPLLAVFGISAGVVIALVAVGVFTLGGKRAQPASVVRPAHVSPAILAPAPLPEPEGPTVLAKPEHTPSIVAKEPPVQAPVPAVAAPTPEDAKPAEDKADKSPIDPVKPEAQASSEKHARTERLAKRAARSAPVRQKTADATKIQLSAPSEPKPAAAPERRANNNSRTGGLGLEEF
jgi:serine/threonine-protein kinase